jgi:hypothetical protein
MKPRTTGLTLSPVESRGITTWPAYRRTQLDEQIERAWALATAFVRRLARHNTADENQGKPACWCERCRWLRTLFDDDPGARLRPEGVTLVPDLNFAESLSQQIEDRDRRGRRPHRRAPAPRRPVPGATAGAEGRPRGVDASDLTGGALRLAVLPEAVFVTATPALRYRTPSRMTRP